MIVRVADVSAHGRRGHADAGVGGIPADVEAG